MKTTNEIRKEILNLQKQRLEITKQQVKLGGAGTEFYKLVAQSNEIGSQIRKLELELTFAK